MDRKSFDFSALLHQHAGMKHKQKQQKFGNTAHGIALRLEKSIKQRKSSRLTTFDKGRVLPKVEPPIPPKAPSEAELKVLHRKQQLEKWKEQKAQAKREEALKKKKPFIIGVAHNPLTFVPPPPPPSKPVPSTSGIVTRSQSARTNIQKQKEVKSNARNQSFAPKNATFQPQIKLAKGPVLTSVPKTKKKIHITFDPVIPEKQMEKTNSGLSRNKIDTTLGSRVDNVRKNHRSKAASPQIRSSRNKAKMENKVTKSDSKTTTKKQKLSKIDKTNKSSKHSNIFTPKTVVPKSESGSEEKLRSPKLMECQTPNRQMNTTISPRVTLSRGKENARAEMKKKIREGFFEEDSSNMEEVQFFRNQMNSEIKRMTQMCQKWEEIDKKETLPEDVHELVLAAVGQARLLMAKKLQQFGTLVERCANPDPHAALVTPADLHGFWDMVFMQVSDVDMRFLRLEKLQAREWHVEEEKAPQKVVQKKVKRTVKPVGAASKLKDVIAAARRAKKEQSEGNRTPNAKTFEGGFFSVTSPVRSPATDSPLRPPPSHSLLKAVLSSNAKGSATKNTASYAILRASLISKNIEIEGIEPLEKTPEPTVKNVTPTPPRSILKSVNRFVRRDTPFKAVLFRDEDKENSPAVSNVSRDEGVVSVQQSDQKIKKRQRISVGVEQSETPRMTRSRRRSLHLTVEQLEEAVLATHITPRRSARTRLH